MGDRITEKAGLRGLRLLISGALITSATVVGASTLAGAATVPSEQEDGPTIVVINHDFRSGTKYWSRSASTSYTTVKSASTKALRVTNKARSSRTITATSSLSPHRFTKGDTVRLSSSLRSSARRGKLFMRAYEYSPSGELLQTQTSAVRSAKTSYQTFTLPVTLRGDDSRVRVRFFNSSAKKHQKLYAKNIWSPITPAVTTPTIPSPSVPTPTDSTPTVPTPTDSTPTVPTPTDPTPTVPTTPTPTTPTPTDPTPTDPTPTTPPPTTPPPTTPPPSTTTRTCADLNDPSRRTMVFNDDFDGSSLDSSKWRVRDNDHLSFDAAYLTKDAIKVGNGAMTIQGRYQSTPKTVSSGLRQRYYSTGYIDSIGKFSQKYGRWEMRAKLPTSTTMTRGVWPAFWLRADKTAGEIDIMEAYGGESTQRWNPGRSYNHTLWEDTNLGKQKGEWYGWAHKDWQTLATPVYEDFHTYGFNWTPDCMQFTFDGVVTATVKPSDVPWAEKAYDSPFNIRLNMQVGSSYWGMPDRQYTKDAFDYVVDRVTVYRPNP